MNERREMAEIYGRGEMDLINAGIREREYIGVMRGNGDGFRPISRGYDHSGTSPMFQRDSFMDEHRSGFASRGQNYDGFVERSSRNVVEDEHRGGFASRDQNYDELVEISSRNRATYDHNDAELRGFRPSGVLENTRGSEFARRGPNYDGLASEMTRNVLAYDRNEIDSRVVFRSNGARADTQISGFASRGQNYGGIVEIPSPLASVRTRANEVRDDTQIRRQNYDGLMEMSLPPLRVGTGNMNELPVEDGRNYVVRERESPPCIGRELPRQLYDDEKDGSRILTPRSLARRRRALFEEMASEGNYSVRERELIRAPYEEENGRMYLPEDGSHSLTPRSHSSGRRTPFQDVAIEGLPHSLTPQEVQYRPSDGVGSASRIQSSRPSSYHRILQSNAGGTSHRFSVEAVSPRREYAPSVLRPDDIHPENQRSRIFYRDIVPELGYNNDQEGTFEFDAASATLPRRGLAGYPHNDVHRDVMVEDEYSGRRNISHPIQVASTLDNSGGGRIVYEMVYDEPNIDLRNSYPGQDILGSLPREERVSFGQDEFGKVVYINSPRRNEVPVMDDNAWQISETGDFTLPNTTRKRMHEFVDEMRDPKRIIVSTSGAMSYDNRHFRGGDGRGLGLSNRIIHRHDEPHSRAHVGMTSTETSQLFPELHRSHELSLSEPQEFERGDVKKRLTFPKAVSRTCDLPWKQDSNSRIKPSVKTSGKGKDTDSKMKLKSGPKLAVSASAAPDPEITIKKKQKLAITDSGNVNIALRSPEIDKSYPPLKVKPLVDLPEDSEKFKEQVNKSFMEYIWYLYRNIGLKERFMGKGTGGSLKCIICSSHAEFAETKDVAVHAFSSLKVGYRAHHVAFHQALCVLMGWDSAVAPNCRWVRQSLPELMVWTLKEDVIIWPPIVIVHTNLAKNDQLNELGKETIELQKFLRDNGFIREIKSVNENPGNPNIMVVKFNGTLSGYKEAERLHNFFSENKLGRVEVAQIDAVEVVCCKLLFKTPKDELELLDKREGDQEPPDTTKAELSELKVEYHLIDQGKGGDEPLDKTKDDQLLVDGVQDDQKPVITRQNGQEFIETAQDDQNPIVKAQDDQELIETAQDGQKHVVTAQDDQKRIDTAEEEQDHVTKTEYVQKPVSKIGHDLLPLEKASDDQTPPDEIEPDQEPVDRVVRTLYGYLGIIEDLNILHQNITSHHCARSKKEIRAFL